MTDDADKALFPPAVGSLLGIKVHAGSAAMRQAGITRPVIPEEARRWRADPDSSPEWVRKLSPRLAVKAERKAARRAARAAEDARKQAARNTPEAIAERARQKAGREARRAAAEAVRKEESKRHRGELRKERARLDEILRASDPDGVFPDDRRLFELEEVLVAAGADVKAACAALERRWPAAGHHPRYMIFYRPAGSRETRKKIISAPGVRSAGFARAHLGENDLLIAVHGTSREWAHCLSTSALKARGWSPSMIRKLLIVHDEEWENPHHAKFAPVKAYQAARVLAAENLPDFIMMARTAAQRSNAGKKAAGTRKSLKALGDEVEAIFSDESVFGDL